jgi:hypothetical protein
MLIEHKDFKEKISSSVLPEGVSPLATKAGTKLGDIQVSLEEVGVPSIPVPSDSPYLGTPLTPTPLHTLGCNWCWPNLESISLMPKSLLDTKVI